MGSENNVIHDATPDPRRWFALVVIAIAQLMVILDSSIVNIALPHAALPTHLGGLGISAKNYQWTITAYTMTFGGFLLLGGRIGDYLGRKKAFLIGLVGFAGASLVGGFAPNQAFLYGARATQGIFGALLAPAALSLISVTFTVKPDESGSASAILNTAQQIGGTFGTAVQNTLYVSAATAFAGVAANQSKYGSAIKAYANVHGYDVTFIFGASMMLVTGLFFYFLVNIDRHHLGQHDTPTVV